MKRLIATYDESDDDSSLFSRRVHLRDGGEPVLSTKILATADAAKIFELSAAERVELERTGHLHVDIEGRPVWVSVY
jgi:hypothetical protein